MDKQQKKSAIMILAIFAVIIIVMVLLIPVEKKNQRYEQFGRLAEVAETDERADYIIEHYEEYPEYITQMFYSNPNDEETLDFVYNYVFCKNNYANMSYTEGELNAEDVPILYMRDERWAYERIGDTDSIIGTDGCAYTCLTMAYISLTGNGDIDPVALANFSYYNKLAGKISPGLLIKKVGEVCDAMGLKGEYYNYDPDEGGTPIESADEIAELWGEDKVLFVGMSGETFGNHALIIREIDGDTIYFNDPASEKKTAQDWNFEDFKSEIIGIWVISDK